MRLTALVIWSFCILAVFCGAFFITCPQVRSEILFAPDIDLLYPISDEVDLTGKSELEFRWNPFQGDLSRRDHYEFCLYKGYVQYEEYMIIRENIKPNVYSFAVSSNVFEDGQVYTWTLRQVYVGSAYKSNANYDSFKVTRK